MKIKKDHIFESPISAVPSDKSPKLLMGSIVSENRSTYDGHSSRRNFPRSAERLFPLENFRAEF